MSKQSVILDLDATLIHTFNGKMNIFEDLRLRGNEYLESRIYMIDFVSNKKKQQMWGVVRPHTHHFLEYCFERFDKVIVWSAGSYEYVHHICEVLFQDCKPHMILTARDCEHENGEAKYKPLEKLYERHDFLNDRNTMIIDDNPDSFSKNKDNAIHISSYSVSFNNSETDEQIIRKLVDDSDVTLSNLIKWLSDDYTKTIEDVKSLEKPRFL